MLEAKDCNDNCEFCETLNFKKIPKKKLDYFVFYTYLLASVAIFSNTFNLLSLIKAFKDLFLQKFQKDNLHLQVSYPFNSFIVRSYTAFVQRPVICTPTQFIFSVSKNIYEYQNFCDIFQKLNFKNPQWDGYFAVLRRKYVSGLQNYSLQHSVLCTFANLVKNPCTANMFAMQFFGYWHFHFILF